ncbi:hypothetical protein RFI_03206 [Reticulomyxa filosa]|uniref:Uncharacterized protein n=1 Tax=Reticulomyxa filosa TaxID=46433 RepID=X6P8E0_RETFI|nr:hypothetical protein RFI_03206 [Reticulomyxa filosa]|eukprot:ETO33892.1 hypothetical protein RFI_03206 [Reticulomyxa filosa]
MQIELDVTNMNARITDMGSSNSTLVYQVDHAKQKCLKEKSCSLRSSDFLTFGGIFIYLVLFNVKLQFWFAKDYREEVQKQKEEEEKREQKAAAATTTATTTVVKRKHLTTMKEELTNKLEDNPSAVKRPNRHHGRSASPSLAAKRAILESTLPFDDDYEDNSSHSHPHPVPDSNLFFFFFFFWYVQCLCGESFANVCVCVCMME